MGGGKVAGRGEGKEGKKSKYKRLTLKTMTKESSPAKIFMILKAMKYTPLDRISLNAICYKDIT
jgi:hypothetical protein